MYVVPDAPPGGWKKGVFMFHNLHATQVRLVLACAHDLQPVACGPDGRGYPIKIEKGWVLKFFRTFGPAIKLGLFAARAAAVATGAGVLSLPYLRGFNGSQSDLIVHLKLNTIDRVLACFGKHMQQAGVDAKASIDM